MKIFINELKEAGNLWYDKDADHIAAAVSYYSVFGLVPFVLLTYFLTGWILGREVLVTKMAQWGSVLDADIVDVLASAIEKLESIAGSFSIPLIGVLFFSGMVIVMVNTFTSGLMKVWGVKHKGIKGWIEKSLRSAVFVAFLQVVIMSSVIIQYLLGKLESVTAHSIVWPLWFLADFTTMALTVLVSYRLLTWNSPSWIACWRGALVVSTLFLILKILVSLYVSITPFPGLFGAAGILIGLLIWVYAMVSLVYLGAAYSYINDKK